MDETRSGESARRTRTLSTNRQSSRLIASALTLVAGTAVGAFGQVDVQRTKATDQTVSFDIPSQPLASALETYSKLTGREVLYSSNLIKDRKSPPLEGRERPDEALAHLLEGSGLSPHYLADRSFVLLPTRGMASLNDVRASPSSANRYYALIQESLRRSLCASYPIRPGSYRMAALLWIGPSGTVVRHERLDSLSADGDAAAETNAGIDKALDHLAIGEAPPPGFVEPVTVAVVPQADGVTMGCTPPSDVRAGSKPRHD